MEYDERLYIEGIKSRVEKLIKCGAWEGIDLARFNSWFNQFSIYNCELLGACLVDALIYRSKNQTEAILQSILTSPEILHQYATRDNALIDALAIKEEPQVRICPVIRMDQPPTKSGMYMLRLAAKKFRIQDEWLKWPQALETEPLTIKLLILIDDFCGSGQQFGDFLKFSSIEKFMDDRPHCRIVYAVVAAHTDGLKYIKERFPRIEIIPGEIIRNSNNFFKGSLLNRSSNSKITENLLTQYKKLTDTVGINPKNVGYLGFAEQALTYSFSHGTPNNTLPIFWDENTLWVPLVNR